MGALVVMFGPFLVDFVCGAGLHSSPPYGGLVVAMVGPQDPLAQCQLFGLLYSLIQEGNGRHTGL